MLPFVQIQIRSEEAREGEEEDPGKCFALCHSEMKDILIHDWTFFFLSWCGNLSVKLLKNIYLILVLFVLYVYWGQSEQ